MSLTKDILSVFLSGYSGSYREMRRQLYGYGQKSGEKFKSVPRAQTIATTIWRLKKQGLLKLDGSNNLKITPKGKLYLHENYEKKQSIWVHGHYEQNGRRLPIIFVFDIPESQKKKRNWLRLELRLLEFKQLQKSVWFGKGPLPEKFINKLNDFNIFQYVHIFEIKQRGTVPKYKKISG